MGFTVIIPARHASTRLPGKMLLNLGGKPMIQHVYEKASQSGAERVIVATDHDEIVNAVKAFSGEALMTSQNHPSGTDRIAEVVEKLKLDEKQIVVNVQGDEPLIDPGIIKHVAENLANNEAASIATVAVPIHNSEEFHNPNVVKVVLGSDNLALYFSRAPIPWPRDNSMEKELNNPEHQDSSGLTHHFHRHIGIYAYTAGFVQRYVKLPRSGIEKIEALEQLRALSNGYKISVLLVDDAGGIGIDTQEDYDKVKDIVERC